MFKYLSGILLMIGSMVGGGILAIPIVSAHFGFALSSIIIIVAWVLMTKTGLIILDLSLSCPKNYNTYYSIVGNYLGKNIQKLATLAFLGLLYFTLSSYISGCISLIISHISQQLSMVLYSLFSLLFVTLFGCIIIAGTKFLMRVNSLFVMIKLSLLIAIILYLPLGVSLPTSSSITIHINSSFISFCVIVINAFGFHFIIPSIVSHYGKSQQANYKPMLIISTSVVLLLYLSWLATIYNFIPQQGEHGLISIYHSSNQLLALNQSLNFYLKSPWILNLIALFQLVALFGSFICVALGVFDFLIDMLKTHNRIYIALLTFTPALILSTLSQNMYVLAMSAAGYIAILLEIIIPLCAKYYTRKFWQAWL